MWRTQVEWAAYIDKCLKNAYVAMQCVEDNRDKDAGIKWTGQLSYLQTLATKDNEHNFPLCSHYETRSKASAKKRLAKKRSPLAATENR